MKIRKGDIVKVLSGKNRGKTGRVLMVDPEKMRVWVEGANLVKRHSRPTQKNPKGGVVEKEGPMHLSKVMLMEGRHNQPTRVGFEVLKDDNGKVTGKVRVSKKTGESI